MRQAVLLVVIFCVSCASTQRIFNQRMDSLDNGFMINNGNCVNALSLPISVFPSYGTAYRWVAAAVLWWNTELDHEFFVIEDNQSTALIYSDHYIEGFTASNQWFDLDELYSDLTYGRASLGLDENGGIVTQYIELNYILAHNDRAMIQSLKHELGHLLGLQDDPGPPVTVDLNSIMADSLIWNGELTRNDRNLIIETYGDMYVDTGTNKKGNNTIR